MQVGILLIQSADHRVSPAAVPPKQDSVRWRVPLHSGALLPPFGGAWPLQLGAVLPRRRCQRSCNGRVYVRAEAIVLTRDGSRVVCQTMTFHPGDANLQSDPSMLCRTASRIRFYVYRSKRSKTVKILVLRLGIALVSCCFCGQKGHVYSAVSSPLSCSTCSCLYIPCSRERHTSRECHPRLHEEAWSRWGQHEQIWRFAGGSR